MMMIAVQYRWIICCYIGVIYMYTVSCIPSQSHCRPPCFAIMSCLTCLINSSSFFTSHVFVLVGVTKKAEKINHKLTCFVLVPSPLPRRPPSLAYSMLNGYDNRSSLFFKLHSSRWWVPNGHHQHQLMDPLA